MGPSSYKGTSVRTQPPPCPFPFSECTHFEPFIVFHSILFVEGVYELITRSYYPSVEAELSAIKKAIPDHNPMKLRIAFSLPPPLTRPELASLPWNISSFFLFLFLGFLLCPPPLSPLRDHLTGPRIQFSSSFFFSFFFRSQNRAMGIA